MALDLTARCLVACVFLVHVRFCSASESAGAEDQCGTIPPHRRGQGGWAQIAVESPSDLTEADFRRQYVDTMTPVILRRPPDQVKDIPISWLGENCDKDADIDINSLQPGTPTEDWGGFKRTYEKSLGFYLDHLNKKKNRAISRIFYGFDYDVKCFCARLMDEVVSYTYFRDDAFLLDPAVDGFVWPSLIVGPPGSSSALHVDNTFSPFHLTVLTGRKIFRIIALEDWRKTLTSDDPLYSWMGDSLKPVDAFDDRAAEEELIGRGSTVYNATLVPGDLVYIPTGALHGALNIGDGPVAAVTANILDPAHSQQILEEFCLKAKDEIEDHEAMCLMLAIDPGLEMGALGMGTPTVREAVANANRERKREYDFWENAVNRPGFCEKNIGDVTTFDKESCPDVWNKCKDKYNLKQQAFLPAIKSPVMNGRSSVVYDMNHDGKTSRLEFLVTLIRFLAKGGHVDLFEGEGGIGPIRDSVYKYANEIWEENATPPVPHELDAWWHKWTRQFEDTL